MFSKMTDGHVSYNSRFQNVAKWKLKAAEDQEQAESFSKCTQLPSISGNNTTCLYDVFLSSRAWTGLLFINFIYFEYIRIK